MNKLIEKSLQKIPLVDYATLKRLLTENGFKRDHRKQSIIKNSKNSQFSCEGKRYSKHMDSCGLSRLDRDHDGVPCEVFVGIIEFIVN